MIFGVADFVAAGYLAWGILKGQRRGLSVEVPRLVSVTLALVTGAGFVRWSDHVLGEIGKLTGQAAGALGWGGALVGAYYLVRLIRARMAYWIEARLPEESIQRRYGMAAGFLRTLVISFIITLFLLHTPLTFLVGNSMMGRLAKIVRPVYHITERPHD